MIVADQRERITSPVAATIGMFDGVHAGHQSVIRRLREAAAERGLSAAVITFANHPQSVLKPRSKPKLLMPLHERLRALSATGLDYSIVLDFDKRLSLMTAEEFISQIADRYSVRLLMVGYDHHFGHRLSDTIDDYAAYGRAAGVEVVGAPELDGPAAGVSSSGIRRLLLEGGVAEAAALLTRPYTLTGTVVGGMHNGRRMGFPTANVELADKRQLVPGNGVYAVVVRLADGSRHGGMLNIGVRPTVGRGLRRTIEVNIFGFSGDIYETGISVSFVGRVRDERRMGSLTELARQLAADKVACEEIINKYNDR